MRLFAHSRRVLYILIPVIPVLVYFFSIYEEPYVLTSYEYNSKPLVVVPYDDLEAGGNSSVTLIQWKPERTMYNYVLGKNIEYPYIGIMLGIEDSSFFDFSQYDYCNITIRAEKGTVFPMYFFTHIKDYSSWDNIYSFHHLQYLLSVDAEWNTLKVPFNEYDTPNWWLSKNKFKNKNFELPDFSKVAVINIANCNILDKTVEDSVEIKEISFHVSYTYFGVYSVLFLCLYFASLFTYLHFVKRRKNAETGSTDTVFVYKKLDIQNNADKEEDTVFNTIISNFSNPELAVTDIQNSTGISERKIAAIIRNKTNLNFKQFLNKLRISEGKRLLLETDLQISEIAFRIGYNNISHFNRVFKSLEAISPGDFRKNNKEPQNRQ